MVDARRAIVVAAVHDAVAGEFNVGDGLKFVQVWVGDEVVEDVFVRAFLTLDAVERLVFDLDIAAFVGELSRRRGQAGDLDVCDPGLGVGRVREDGDLDGRGAGVNG